MKIAQIVHNPTAGNGEHRKEDIIKYVEACGYDIRYVSTHDQGWKDFLKDQPDIIFLAGGDGTVHKLAAVLLEMENLDQPPVYLLPMGTANNIATTLQLQDRSLTTDLKIPEKVKKFDHGLITGLDGYEYFFESVGMGIFPKLITEMKKGDEIEDPAEKLKHTLKVLQKILGEYEAEKFEITVDKNKLSGSYLMVEVMNINYVGPNLKLAPDADPGDGLLDVVLVPGENRVKLLQYLDEMSKGKVEDTNVYEFVKIYRAKEVTIKYQGKNVHLDDDFIENYSGEEIHLQAASGGLKFFSDK